MKRFPFYFLVLFLSCAPLNAQEYVSAYESLKKNKKPLAFSVGDIDGKVQFKWKPETFYARNSNLLNNSNKSDQLFRNQSTVDTNLNLKYGSQCFGHPATEFFVTLRNKNIWGNPRSILSTTESTVKLVDYVGGSHRHDITRLVPWVREIWLRFNIGDVFGVGFSNDHHFTLGAFPFELGRGIALGAAYGINPVALGFYSDNTIDQYAFGFKFSGRLHSTLTYDLYGEIVDNKSSTFNQTTEKVLGQQFGFRNNQVRGGGKVEYIVAGRLRWIPVSNAHSTVSFEPYLLYLDAPEQRVEINADSESKLGTFGMAGEYVYGNLEWGFDAAINTGRQVVPGIDRNIVDLINVYDAPAGGRFQEVNTGVVTQQPTEDNPNPPKAPFVAGSEVQRIIERSPQAAAQNGEYIGSGTLGSGGDIIQLYNDFNRFREPKKNSFKGWMAVADASYWIYKRKARLAAGIGAASGDENPNINLDDPNASNPDNNYKGFVSLQELYTGERIQSAFFLGGAGRVPRPLSTPTRRIDRLRVTPSRANGFTNLLFGGVALHWFPTICDRNLVIRPNIMFFGQQHATRKFDIATKQSLKEPASRFYGTEINTFADVALMPDFKLYFVGSVFVPGGHYNDIKGTPLDRDQQKIIDKLDATGIDFDRVPLLGTDTAYTINIGLELRV